MVQEHLEKAKLFFKYKIPAFIIIENGDWNWVEIDEVLEDFMYVIHISGDKLGIKQRIFYIDIIRFEEIKNFKKKEEKKDGR